MTTPESPAQFQPAHLDFVSVGSHAGADESGVAEPARTGLDRKRIFALQAKGGLVVLDPAAIHVAAGATDGWVDPQSGTSEHAMFLDTGNGRIITFVHSPARHAPRALVTICGSLFEDLHVNYRTELLLARELARRGCAVLRLHYRQTGNSDDLADDILTFESMSRDVLTAVAWAQGQHPGAPVVLCGFRMGGLVAASLVDRADASLVLWAPVISGVEYFRRLSRASRLAGVRATAADRSTSGGTESDLRDGQSVELLGHRVHAATYSSLSAHELPVQIGQRPVLILEVGLSGSAANELSQATSRWRGSGAAVSTQRISARQQWFVPDKWEPEDSRPETGAIVSAIADWVSP
jgi:alpha/beta superfamily hydrolase